MGKKPRSKEEVLEFIQTFLKDRISGLKGIYLFGSQAQDQANQHSDWDLAFLTDFNHSINPINRWKIQEELAAQLNRDVDLVDLRKVSTVMQFQVLSTGSRLWCDDPGVCGVFEMLTYSYYQRLQQERKDILSQIARTGKVYSHG